MISVLVVNLNNLEYTKNCINDLLKQDCNFDLTIVDQNSSESGTTEYFSSLPENVEFIQNYENKPLNHLWNWFVEKSQTTYVCLLNNDVRIAPNFLSSAIQILEKEPNVGFVNHVSNNKDYQEWSNELKYKIIETPYRQGWDPIFRKECYSNIPEELSFFYGDDYIYSKLYSSGMKGAYVLNSPMIHFERSTTIEKGGQRDASPDGDFYYRLDLQFKNLSFVEELSKWKPEFLDISEYESILSSLHRERKIKLFDFCLFNNEFEILELRLNYMSNFVDRFYVCEIDITHQSNKSEFYSYKFIKNSDLAKKLIEDERLIFVRLSLQPSDKYFDVEIRHRIEFSNWVKNNIKEEFIGILSDCDEIISEDIINYIDDIKSITKLDLKMFYFAADNYSYKHPWCEWVKLFHSDNLIDNDFQGIRIVHTEKTIDNIGWHFSSFGGTKNVIDKLQSFSHTEHNNDVNTKKEILIDRIKNKEDILGREQYPCIRYDVNNFPKNLLSILKKNKSMLYINELLKKEYLNLSDRVYITHVTKDYLDVAINLAKSLDIFSNIPLIIYCIGLEDTDKEKFDKFTNVSIRNIDLDIESKDDDYTYDGSGNFYINRSSSRIYKILSAKTIAMQMALEEGWQEVCYLDSDCLATPLVDELFDWSTNISDFPLATEGIHEYMVVIENGKQRGNPFEFTWPIADNKLSLEWPLMNFMQMLPEQRGRYRTTGIMLMNQNCLSFIKTWRELCFLLPKLVDTNYYAPFHEETIYNVLSWKKENKGFPLCYINLGEGLESVKHLYSEEAKEGNLRWSDTDTSQNFYKIPDNKKYVKVLHGEKRPSEVDKILNFISDKKSEAKILVQIDTFPDTKEKIETTKYCIESLRFLGYPILLTSHIDIPEELKLLCDYSYTDNNNILLPPTGDINYFYYGNSSIYMRFKIDDIEAHSPSVITGWLNGAKFCKQNGFTHYLKVEYDFILDESSVDKLKNSIHQSSDSKEGFVLLRDNYVVPKIIFASANLVNELNIDIKSYHDYFNYCYKFSVPDKLKRIAGVFTYHALINKFQNLNVYPSENENYFKTKFINLENAFLGFLSPLLGSDGDIYLCSYGLSNRFSEFTLLEDGVCVKNNNINFNKDAYSVTKINIKPDSKYELIYDNTTLEFKLVDILENKFGTIKFN